VIAATQHMPPAAPAAPAAAVRTVAVTDAAVTPSALVVAPGTEVMWRNRGRNRHTVTADGGAFASEPLFSGDAFTIGAPATPGVYAYHCRFHSYIRGTLTVSLVSLETPAVVRVGRMAALSGTAPGSPAGTPVTIERRVPGAWEPVATAATDASGAFSAMSGPLSGRTAFRAAVGDSLSPSVRAQVAPDVTARRRGARLTVSVSPPSRGATVRLEQLDLDSYRWRVIASRTLAGGAARFTLGAPGVYRGRAEARGALAAAASPAVMFRAEAFMQ
jgi:plastocyanin